MSMHASSIHSVVYPQRKISGFAHHHNQEKMFGANSMVSLIPGEGGGRGGGGGGV